MDYSIAQQSFQGGRDYNEDRTAIFERDNALLVIVADGLGGHDAGDLASQTFVDAMSASFRKASVEQLQNAGDFLTLSINYAHHMVHRRAVDQGYNADGPKTTCVVCLVYDGVAQWAHSGDSRLYLIHDNEIIERTEDHVSKRPRARGNHPINRCVGGVDLPRPEISERHDLNEGDIFVLASDGAWANFTPDDLREYVDPEYPNLGLDNMLQRLEERNKAPSDNLSMVILFWGIKQLDEPEFSDKLNSSHLAVDSSDFLEPEEQPKPYRKFNMDELDSAIGEIESFISELDQKL